jgi:uncharacterized 2Fe-2S/4Fe-4S cluster protein (DUF4445 family)
MKIIFMPQEKTGEYQEGITIAAAAEEAGLPLDLVCGGRGRCGKCKVFLQEDGKPLQEVLACQEKLLKDATVHIPSKLLKREAVILTGSNLGRVKLEPLGEKVFLPAEKLKAHTSDGDFERLALALGRPGLALPPLNTLQQLPRHLKSPQGLTAFIFDQELVSLEEGDTTPAFYGMAVDIGTTTVVAYLYNLNTGEQVSVVSSLNKQTTVGADVMARINEASTDRGLIKLHGLIMETMGQLIKEGCDAAGIRPQDIYLVTLVGNSTMQHLFLNFSPYNLGRKPFTSTLLKDIILPAADLLLGINPVGRVVFLPLIGGFVGADTTGVLLATALRQAQKIRLVIDIGTNGEMVLGNREQLLACSTAAGPALEGAGIAHGMRGTGGAIEDVTFGEDGVNIKVIGHKKATGICGSGLVACMAEMLKAGMVKATGRLLSKEEFLAAGGSPILAVGLMEVDGHRVFMLTPPDGEGDNGIFLSQGDIRAVQLAKGAISTGVTILLEEMGVKGEDLEEIYLAGAFGNYIDVRKGQIMGLIPDFPGVPVRPVGNAAGGGAQKALLSRHSLREANRISFSVQHVELASHPHFQDRFISSLTFPSR